MSELLACWVEVAPEEIAVQEAILEDTVRRCGRSTRQFRIRRARIGINRKFTANPFRRIFRKFSSG